MKRVYFVRHGESESNITEVVQGLSDPLSLEGERQALLIAERAKNLDFEILLSSDAVRARNTADAISKATQKSVVESAHFREIRRPTSLIGISNATAVYKDFLKAEYEHRQDASWRFEDEENYHDSVQRAQEALALLCAQTADDVLVVTHGHFLRFMLAVMVMGEALTPDLWYTFGNRFKVSNTGITTCIREPIPRQTTDDAWRILTWNDHAHFAE